MPADGVPLRPIRDRVSALSDMPCAELSTLYPQETASQKPYPHVIHSVSRRSIHKLSTLAARRDLVRLCQPGNFGMGVASDRQREHRFDGQPHAAIGQRGKKSEGQMTKTSPRGVLLDLDGTLIDSNDAHAHAWVTALAGEGFDIPFARVRRLIGRGATSSSRRWRAWRRTPLRGSGAAQRGSGSSRGIISRTCAPSRRYAGW